MRILRSIPAILVMALFGCGLGNISVDISPKSATVAAKGQAQFSASVNNAGNKTVLWSTTGGTVTDTGLYTAPTTAGTYLVVATSQADPSKTDTATVNVPAPVVVTPGTVSLAQLASQTFTAVVTATGDTNMTWTVQETDGGVITAGGVYTAPAAAGTYHVVATSVADPLLFGTAVVIVN